MIMLEQLAENGWPGLLLSICLGAIVYLYKAREAQSLRAIEERGEFVTVMVNHANSNAAIAA